MNKVKCINGHFFDLDKFNCCPICGGGSAGQSDSRKSRTPAEPSRQSRLGDVDKTALLVEEETSKSAPVTGKAGGIKWRFGKKDQDTPEKEQKQPKRESDQTAPGADGVSEMRPQSELGKMDALEQSNESAPTPPPSLQPEPADSALTQAVAATGHSALSALPKTVAYYDFAETEPPTGWMVCVKGVYQGQAFACKTGRNRIGRNPNCDVSLMNDTSITREPHAIIIYDPKQKIFYLQNGSGDGLVYLNESLLFSHEQLHAYDKIQLGNAEFVFLPLCGEQFTWDDYIS